MLHILGSDRLGGARQIGSVARRIGHVVLGAPGCHFDRECAPHRRSTIIAPSDHVAGCFSIDMSVGPDVLFHSNTSSDAITALSDVRMVSRITSTLRIVMKEKFVLLCACSDWALSRTRSCLLPAAHFAVALLLCASLAFVNAKSPHNAPIDPVPDALINMTGNAPATTRPASHETANLISLASRADDLDADESMAVIEEGTYAHLRK